MPPRLHSGLTTSQWAPSLSSGVPHRLGGDPEPCLGGESEGREGGKKRRGGGREEKGRGRREGGERRRGEKGGREETTDLGVQGKR